MPIIPRSPQEVPGRGQWSPWVVDGKRTALFACPACGTVGTLETHTIADDGTVTPSVRCDDDCAYHESGLKLESWKPS